MSDLMDRINREIRERCEKVHLWATDDGYMFGLMQHYPGLRHGDVLTCVHFRRET